MQMNRYQSLTVAATLIALISGCSPSEPEEKMPTVNTENCKPANIAMIKDKGIREQFSSVCLRSGGEYKSSEKRAW